MGSPLVSIIIVNWNGEGFLKTCLSSLRTQTYRDFEVIVVDNFSKDNSIRFLEDNYSDLVKIVKNPDNLGFAKANNIGIIASRGEFIVTLNNDTQADTRWLEELVKAAKSEERIGMCASKILSFYQRDTIDSVGVNIYWDGMSRARGRLQKDSGQFNTQREVLIPSACAALYKKEMLNKIGLFDEDFFAYCEDTDLGLRARVAGWKCVLAPAAVVYHFYSATSGSYSPLKAFLVERNHIWVALKVFPWPVLLMFPFFTSFRLIIQAISAFKYSAPETSEGQNYSKLKIFFAVLKAYPSACKAMVNIFKKRKLILATKKVSDSEIYAWFRKYRLTAKELTLN